MSDEWREVCDKPPAFPKKAQNLPRQSRIRFRIGRYADMVQAMLYALNRDDTLRAWSHRETDDPGIALLHGAAVLGDILTFYQELYANESYLWTAQWRESVAELVRLTGYRLKPGVGGMGTFAFLMKDGAAVDIPAGLPLKVQLEGQDAAVEVEIAQSLLAVPTLSEFYVYRPRNPRGSITSGSSTLELTSAGGSPALSKRLAVDIKKGDRIMLVPDSSMYDSQITYIPQKKAEILVVKAVEQTLDRVSITFEGSLTQSYGASVRAFRIGRTFKHFGHNAPPQLTEVKETTIDGTKTNYVTQNPTDFDRAIYAGTYGSTHYPALKSTEMPLAKEVDDLAAGNQLICQGWTTFDGVSVPTPFAVVKDIVEVKPDALVWGNYSGATTMVVIDARLISNSNVLFEEADIRKMAFHEVTSVELTLQAATTWHDGPFSDVLVNCYCTYDDVIALAGRRLALVADDGTQQIVTVTSQVADFTLPADRTALQLWSIALSAKPQFAQIDLDEAAPEITAYGNLVDATQGKTERTATLGNGDSRAVFQTFKLPKAPLTFLLDAAATPAEMPELLVYVNDRLWTVVPSLFEAEPDDEVYIVREDADGDSWVQFGDGVTGKRLPSGIGNVVAIYRTGNAAYGAQKTGTKVQAGKKVDRLDKIQLFGVVSGGDEAEDGDHAREVAPGRVQSLDRMVSLRDVETETLAIPGVRRAQAAWQLMDHVPTVTVTVLMETGRAAELATVRDILARYNRSRGPSRYPLLVYEGQLRYVSLLAAVAIDATYQSTLVLDAIRQALGDSQADTQETGLLASKQRQFGQPVYASQISGVIQNVPGVLWARLDALSALGASDSPASLSASFASYQPTIACDNQHILSLYPTHLKLVVQADSAQGGTL